MSPPTSSPSRFRACPGLVPVPAGCPGGEAGGCGVGGGVGGLSPVPPGAAGAGGPRPGGERRDAGALRRSPTASLAAGHAFGGKKGIFRLRPAEVPGCLPTTSRAAPRSPGPVSAPPPPGKAVILPDPRGICSAPPGLSITSRRPQALGTPWGRYGTPPPGRGVLLLHGLRRQSCRFARQK